jgi:hypothetical protein
VIRVIGPRDPKEPGISKKPFFVNTTSRSSDGWSVGLSPFFLGPVPLYDGHVSRNVENAWQYAKVYEDHDDNGQPTDEYFEWAKKGWRNPRAVRYPMGKGAKPEYSWWDGAALGYVAARKKIYVPLYSKAVLHSAAFERLLDIYQEHGELVLWDFDGYDHRALGMDLKDVLNFPDRSMGHAFVLMMLLEAKLRQ